MKTNVPEDVYEQEADSVADQVMSMREQATEQRQEIPEEEKVEEEQDDYKSTVQTKSLHRAFKGALDVNDDIETRIRSSKGGGIPIANEVRAFVEPRMQFDFSKVRVHRDNEAIQMNQELGARAFTHGIDIYFGAGQYTPKSTEGRRLITHELTHVVQQGGVEGSSTVVQRDDLSLEPVIRELAKGPTKAERVLKFIGKWGRNASPFNIAMTYVRLNWKGVSYWMDVRKSAKAGRALLKHIAQLERGARALKEATDELYRAESKLPSYPLQTDEKAGQMMVTNAELEYVEKYYNTAAKIANDAMAASSELRKAIAGWDAVVEQANKNNDFTRASAWDAIISLNLRFNNEGSDFRTYLVNACDRANAVESWARSKQYHAADILGKWTPEGYQPPSGPF